MKKAIEYLKIIVVIIVIVIMFFLFSKTIKNLLIIHDDTNKVKVTDINLVRKRKEILLIDVEIKNDSELNYYLNLKKPIFRNYESKQNLLASGYFLNKEISDKNILKHIDNYKDFFHSKDGQNYVELKNGINNIILIFKTPKITRPFLFNMDLKFKGIDEKINVSKLFK